MQTAGTLGAVERLQKLPKDFAPGDLDNDVALSPEKPADLEPWICHVCAKHAPLVCLSCGLPFCRAHGWGRFCCMRCYRFTLVALPMAGLCWVLWEWLIAHG
jgi:hypothetical protein